MLYHYYKKRILETTKFTNNQRVIHLMKLLGFLIVLLLRVFGKGVFLGVVRFYLLLSGV